MEHELQFSDWETYGVIITKENKELKDEIQKLEEQNTKLYKLVDEIEFHLAEWKHDYVIVSQIRQILHNFHNNITTNSKEL